MSLLGDQRFWGKSVAAFGAGPRPLRRRDLTADGLAHAIRETVERPSYAAAAGRAAASIAGEDGVATAVARIEEHLRPGG